MIKKARKQIERSFKEEFPELEHDLFTFEMKKQALQVEYFESFAFNFLTIVTEKGEEEFAYKKKIKKGSYFIDYVPLTPNGTHYITRDIK